MTKQLSSSQRDMITTALVVLLFLRGCDTRFSNIDLGTTELDPATTGFLMTGHDSSNFFGISASSAGDIDNDGYEDMIVGADGKGLDHGLAYVIYGGPKSSMSDIDLSSTTLDPATTGFLITGTGPKAHFGHSVSTAGDIDNDGYDDLIIGAYGKNTNSGVAYVIYGGPRSSMSNIDLSITTLDPKTTGFTIIGPPYGYFGLSVGAAGDINNDGYGDIIVGARGKNLWKGGAYVIYGGPKSSMSNLNLDIHKLDPAKTGFVISGNTESDQLGISVSAAGDIDNDGYDDIIAGAGGKNGDEGAAYVIYGGPTSSMANIDLSKSVLNPLNTGFIITGNKASDNFGSSVGKAGDINNDGYDDIIVGAQRKNSDEGAAYLIYGGPRSSMSNIDLNMTDLYSVNKGFIITGNAMNDWFGDSVATVGDLNHDGYSDIIIGAFGTNSKTGTAYVVYGGEKSSMSNIDLSTTDLYSENKGFTITGNAPGDGFGSSVSTAGDINHDGYDDIIIGAAWKSDNYGAAYVIYGGPSSTTSNIYY